MDTITSVSGDSGSALSQPTSVEVREAHLRKLILDQVGGLRKKLDLLEQLVLKLGVREEKND